MVNPRIEIHIIKEINLNMLKVLDVHTNVYDK